jgi:DNA-binding transcriptional LysR family regulator
MWEAIDLRELRVFLTLAEELHFGRTAERLRLTPSRVSQSLRELEDKLGAQLVHRTSRRVRLTSFGERLLEEVGPAYRELTRALEQTHAAARSLAGSLRLGLFSGPAEGPHLMAIVDAFGALHPECDVDVVQLSWDDPLAQLRQGAVDLIGSWLPLEQQDVVVGPVLTRQPRVVAVAPQHPLAERTTVSYEDLAEEAIPRFDGWPRELHEALLPSKTPSGRPISQVRIPAGERNFLEITHRVARQELVLPTVASAAPLGIGHYDLVYVPITGMAPARSALVWRRGVRDPKLREFVRLAREVLRAAQDPTSSARKRTTRSAEVRSGSRSGL